MPHESGDPKNEVHASVIVCNASALGSNCGCECRSGSMMMRQLHFAMLDLELHARFKPGGKETVFDVDHRIAEKTMVMQPLPEDR